MKIYGTIKELVATWFKAGDGNNVILQPPASPGATRTITLPNATDTLVGKATTDTFTNKTFDADGTGNSITNIENADIKAGAAIDATKIGAGSVDNTEFGYLNGVTSSIQTQLGNKAASGANSDITSLSGLTTALSIGQGGTGQTTAQNARNALLPTQTPNSGKYLKTDGTDVSWASASGGAGEINAILNASGADGTTGWTGTTVVSGSSSPLNPIVTTAFSIANSATSESSTSGGYYPFTMPSGLLNRKLKVEFTFTTPATDVWRVSVYQGSTRVPLSTDSSSVTTLPASVTGGKFTAYFDTDSNTSWTLSVTRTSGSTGACVITNVIVGPGIQPQGAVVGEPVTLTLTTTNAAATPTITARGYRVGTTLHLKGTVVLAGANTNTLFVNLPAGYTIDTTKLPTGISGGASDYYVGVANFYDANTGNYYDYQVVANTTTRIYFLRNSGVSQSIDASNPVTAASTDTVVFEVDLPIAEWAGSGTVNLAQNDVEYAYNTGNVTAAGGSDTTSFGYGPAGTALLSYASTTAASDTAFTVRFQTPIQVTDSIILEVNNGTGWFPMDNFYTYSILNTSRYGASWYVSGTSEIVVLFGNQGFRPSGAATYAASGSAWSSLSSYKWRVRKSSAGAAVGFGLADTAGNAGLVNPYSSSGAGVVYSGTYTPTITAVTAAGGTKTAFQTHFIRVGQRVMVNGYMEVTGTSGTTNEVSLTLPITSTLGTSDLYGTAVSQNKEKVGGIQRSGNLALVGWQAADALAHGIYFNFMYEIN